MKLLIILFLLILASCGEDDPSLVGTPRGPLGLPSGPGPGYVGTNPTPTPSPTPGVTPTPSPSPSPDPGDNNEGGKGHKDCGIRHKERKEKCPN